ncbi:hypothetical protein OE88DRAFT_1734384 [Heliocybe sulcata]|uniref:Ubiquitin-like domain-containing protein n=1 Tax=Heliocybe sulcata TaxID=5364 RepID=A0A5C3NFS9_9AGAM|nr:hypothetical protein OE88DRAFT_1734384 [Heliocybe sulcata]
MSRPLSEKAKGKQRAIEPEQEGGSSSTSAGISRALTVRFTEGFQDLELRVKQGKTVRYIKRQIRDARPELQNRRLRLIHSGKLLTDKTDIYKLLTSLEERQHRRAGVDEDADEVQPLLAANWLHCSVGAELPGGEEDVEVSQTGQIRPLRGFDRLAAAGFSEEDIASIRRQFHNSSAHDYLDSDLGEESDYDERARILEEQWIDALDHPDNSLSDSNPAGSTVVLRGIVMGFFFPLLPFFFFREAKPALFWENGQEHESLGSVIFSKRMQMGIVVGFLANFSFGLWRYLLTT